MKSEFDFVRAIRTMSASRQLKSKIKFGIGDDCAVIKQNNQTDLVITADLLVENIDFRLQWTKPEFIGHKALAVSLSDVAAMGAKPVWALVSIGVPKHIWESDFVEKFYEGWFKLAKKFNVALVGGDVSRTPDKIVVDSIVAGEVNKNGAVLRSSAKAGDLIFVTGKLGGAAAALQLLESSEPNGLAKSKLKKLVQRQLLPMPQTKIGRKLGKLKLATAMIDVSDGLSSDLAHLCEASQVGARIYADKIPIDKSLLKVDGLKTNALEFALNGGEDFELLFTASKKNYNKILQNFSSVSQIGEINKNVGKIEFVRNSDTALLSAKGFQHFT